MVRMAREKMRREDDACSLLRITVTLITVTLYYLHHFSVGIC
jgi:hypothetical protein